MELHIVNIFKQCTVTEPKAKYLELPVPVPVLLQKKKKYSYPEGPHSKTKFFLKKILYRTDICYKELRAQISIVFISEGISRLCTYLLKFSDTFSKKEFCSDGFQLCSGVDAAPNLPN
jgi:hypothetical protein